MKNSYLKSLKVFCTVCLFISTFALYSGCDEDTNPINPVTPTANLSVTHASPDAPNVDILLDDVSVATNVPFLGTFQYKSVPGDAVTNLKIRVAGTSTTVIDTALYMQQGRYYSVFAYDSVSKIKPLFLTDNLSAPTSPNANVRLLNLSPNGPTIDVGVTGKSNWFAFNSFAQAPSFRPIVGDTTYASLNVYSAGTSNVLYSTPNVSYTSGKIYTFMVNGFINGTGTQAYKLTTYPND